MSRLKIFTMLNRRTFSVFSSATLVAGFQTAHAQAEAKIVLGQSAPFTGAAAQLGIQFNAGAKVYFEQINARGGINRRPIELLAIDDGYEPERCAENTRKLIAQDAFALFGYIGTPTSLAALPIATQERVPFIAPFTGAMSLREPLNKMAFHLRASYDDETALIVKQLHNLGLKKIAVFYQNDAYGKAGLSGVTKALDKEGLKPVALATVERNSVDVAAAVKTIVAAGPDAIVQVSAYKSCAAFIREARKASFGGTFFNVSFVGTEALADELGREGAGVVVSQVVPAPSSLATGIGREYNEAIKAYGKGATANYSSLEGYLAARLVADGLRNAGGKTTRDALVTGLEAIGSQSYGGFAVALSPANHVASRFVQLSMLTGDGRVRV
jgi:branched-chain amino acid transport system substrate-binding protein